MKKVIYVLLFVFATSFTITSCRDTKSTGEKVEDGIEEVADDVEEAAEDVKDEVEDVVDDN